MSGTEERGQGRAWIDQDTENFIYFTFFDVEGYLVEATFDKNMNTIFSYSPIPRDALAEIEVILVGWEKDGAK